MVRFAIGFAFVSLSSVLVLGCAGHLDSESTADDGDALEARKGCIYDSSRHVIDCVPPRTPDPSTGKKPSSHVDCDDLAAELDDRFDAAAACGGAPSPTPECQALVPTTTGCEAPVALAGSDATRAYLKLWDVYAAHCPVPHPPCVDPELLESACVASANHGGHGTCAFVDGAPPPAPGNASP